MRPLGERVLPAPAALLGSARRGPGPFLLPSPRLGGRCPFSRFEFCPTTWGSPGWDQVETCILVTCPSPAWSWSPPWCWSRLVPGAQEAPWQPHFLPAEQARVWTGTSLGLPLGLSRQPTCRCPGLVTAWPSLSPAPAPARRGVQPGPLQPQRHRPIQAQVPGARRRAAPARLPRVADDPPVLPVPALHQHPAAQPAHRHVQVSADSLPPPTLPAPTPPRSAARGRDPGAPGASLDPRWNVPATVPGTRPFRRALLRGAQGTVTAARGPCCGGRGRLGVRGAVSLLPAPGDCGGLWAAGRGPPSPQDRRPACGVSGRLTGKATTLAGWGTAVCRGSQSRSWALGEHIGVARFRSSGRKHYFSVARERGRRS